MYYLYKKTRNLALPRFAYNFKNFNEFYEVAPLLEVPLIGVYNIRVKSDDFKEISNFIDTSATYQLLQIYIEVSEALLDDIRLSKPKASFMSTASSYEIFKELVASYGVLFAPKCLDIMYWSIGHTYEDMDEALQLIKSTYTKNTGITKEDISKLFVIDDKIYPRSVLLMYIRLDRGRESALSKCVDCFGNDIVYYSMRKTVRKLLDEKIKYMKTGNGSKLIKSLPINNLVHMIRCLDYENEKYKDIKTILRLYEKGESVYDFIQERASSYVDA